MGSQGTAAPSLTEDMLSSATNPKARPPFPVKAYNALGDAQEWQEWRDTGFPLLLTLEPQQGGSTRDWARC